MGSMEPHAGMAERRKATPPPGKARLADADPAHTREVKQRVRDLLDKPNKTPDEEIQLSEAQTEATNLFTHRRNVG